MQIKILEKVTFLCQASDLFNGLGWRKTKDIFGTLEPSKFQIYLAFIRGAFVEKD